jgi:RluA family pseudouridine synthase
MNIKDFVLFEDKDIIVLNKPAGWLSIPDGYSPTLPCLKYALAQEFGRIWVVHRLDKLTSGVILFAKNEDAHRNLNGQFNRHIISKNYRAIAHGYPIWNEKVIQIPLHVDGDRHHRTIADQARGKPAQTHVILQHKNEQYCFLDIFPKTGLTHQIRAHLASCGIPVVGDRLYWRAGQIDRKHSFEYPFSFGHMYLHAYSLKVQHPLDHKSMQFFAPEPPYFKRFYHDYF